MIPNAERRCLQIVVTLLSLVPLSAGAAGAFGGGGFIGLPFAVAGLDADSHFRYLSGIFLGVGLGFWSTVPAIETKGERFRLLTAFVFLGGLARLGGALLHGLPGPFMIAGLALELIVTPALALWQLRISRHPE